MQEQLIEFDDDGVRIILEWDEVNPLYSVNVTVTPETQVSISNSTARLMVNYNVMYNVSVIVSHPCGQNSGIIFSKVCYYPSTNARECSVCIPLSFLSCKIILVFNLATSTCRNPEAQIADSVIVAGYTDPAVEGTTVTFDCPPGLVYTKRS